jgi:hypothetical protein
MDFKKIEWLESTTPRCFCGAPTYFLPGYGYALLKCHDCGFINAAPTSLTQDILDAYKLKPVKNSFQNRLKPCIL